MRLLYMSGVLAVYIATTQAIKSDEAYSNAECRQQHVCSIDNNPVLLYEDGVAFEHVENNHNNIKETQARPERLQKDQIIVTTVTQILFIDQPWRTPTPPTGASVTERSVCSDTTSNTMDKVLIPFPSLDKARRWSLLSTPFQLGKTIAVGFFSYVAVPLWLLSYWIVRVLIYKPAVFIYLLFLEKPFKTILTLFLWLLPLLAFAIATTVAGAITGGTFGWISAILSKAFQTPVNDNKDMASALNAKDTHSALSDLADISGTSPTQKNFVLNENSDRNLSALRSKDSVSYIQSPDTDQNNVSSRQWTRRRLSNISQLPINGIS